MSNRSIEAIVSTIVSANTRFTQGRAVLPAVTTFSQ